MAKDSITMALPKGKLGEDAVEILEQAGLPCQGLSTDSRKLTFEFTEENLCYIICRPTDIPTYVEYGAADMGMVGKDTLVEAGSDVFELVDLRFGACKFVVAVPQRLVEMVSHEGLASLNHCRVATKFPRVAKEFFGRKGMQVEVIKLHGNIELAPAVGLADAIVDIVSTGRTLRENNLMAVEEIFHSTARLIANRASFRMKGERVQQIVASIREVIGNGGYK